MRDQDSQRWLDVADQTHRQLTRALGAVAEVEAQRRRAVRLAVAAGCTHQEVAEVLGLSRVRVTRLVNGN